MTYTNITKSVLINEHEKDHSMIETLRLKNVVIFIPKILSFVLSRKILLIYSLFNKKFIRRCSWKKYIIKDNKASRYINKDLEIC